MNKGSTSYNKTPWVLIKAIKYNIFNLKVDLITLGVHQKFIIKNFDYLRSSAQVVSIL